MSRWCLGMAAMGALIALLAGCGGSSVSENEEYVRDGNVIRESPAMEQLRADLATAGKPLPDFLADGVIQTSEIAGETVAPASYMSALSLGSTYGTYSCASRRASWYECNLTSSYYPVDVNVTDRGGDPDLYVFSPLRSLDAYDSLILIGYSVGTYNEHVGSFYPEDFGGPGRFIAAIYAYGRSTAYYSIRFW